MREIFVKNDTLKEFWDGIDPVDRLLASVDMNLTLSNKKLVDHNVVGVVTHPSYGEYLKIAYNNDYGIVVRPEFIWYTIMQQIAGHVKSHPDEYRPYFTTEKNGKSVITGHGTDFIHLPVMDILNQLLPKIPSFPKNSNGKKLTVKERREIILPPFSTATPESQITTAASFLEAASEYYSFQFYGCMYNKIMVMGTPEDYGLMFRTVNQYFGRMFPPLDEYRQQLQTALGRIQVNWDNDDFWRHILWTEQGYMQQNVDGWFSEFFIGRDANKKWNTMPYGGYSGNLGGFTVVPYKEIITDCNYTMVTGLLSSTIEDGYMVPHFEQMVLSMDEEAEVKRADERGSSFKYPVSPASW